MRKIKNLKYLKWLRQQNCALCGFSQTDPHHIGDSVHTKRGNDEFCVPVCREHHISIHNHPELYEEMLKKLAKIYWEEYESNICIRDK